MDARGRSFRGEPRPLRPAARPGLPDPLVRRTRSGTSTTRAATPTTARPREHNAQGLCEACNYAKDAPGWRARPGPDGGVETMHTRPATASPPDHRRWRASATASLPRPDDRLRPRGLTEPVESRVGSAHPIPRRYRAPMSTATEDRSTLLDRARAWAAEDPDPQTRAELEPVVADVEAGGDRAPTWPTASPARWSSARPGCAARSAPGPNRMNRVVVIRAAAGLAAYLRDHGRRRRHAS